jgi:hypothetical protein
MSGNVFGERRYKAMEGSRAIDIRWISLDR